MIKYILIHESLYTAQMRGQHKNYNERSGFYRQDTEDTIAKYQFPGNDKWYYVLSWPESGGKPSSVLGRYKEDGRNPKENKIHTRLELWTYLRENAVRDLDDTV